MTKPVYEFTNHWFADNQVTWDGLLEQFKPQKILEIGAYEGQATCYLIAALSHHHPLEIHCIDTWQGGVEHQTGASAQTQMQLVEQRFLGNVQLALDEATRKGSHSVSVQSHKDLSCWALARLISDPAQRGTFDLVYVDGSHQAKDVLCDAVMAFQLLRVGGLMIFDDYLWHEEPLGQQDLLNMPKIAIDAFTNIMQRHIRPLFGLPNNQVYLQKL
jgi:predicted O-methyltransferase YrrM